MIRTINTAVARRREELQNGENDKGFTLIELMVVIIIIGILAAIAIPVFLNQRQSAWEGAVKSDLANAAIAAEAYSVKNNGGYSDISETKLEENGFKPSDKVHVVATQAGDGYTLVGTNENITDKSWTFTSSTGKTVENAVG